MNEKLVEYLKKHAEIGSDINKVKRALINVGWDAKTVEEHISHVFRAKKESKKPLKTGFLFLIVIFVLIVAASAYYLSGFKKEEKTAVAALIKPADRSMEFFNLALLKSDISACDEIKDANLKQECHKKFLPAMGNATQECDAVCKNKELLNRALISSNATLCLEIADAPTKENCERAFAKKNGNQTKV